jgi:hypothetical protein
MRRTIISSIGLVALVVVLAPAAWAENGPVSISGTQPIVDEKKGEYLLRGSLVGKFNNTAFKLHYAGPDGQVVGSGKEIFIGCHDTDRSGVCDAGEPSGTLRFSFIFWATYNPKTQALIKGQCVHPVIAGTGDFAKAKGVIHMRDRPTKTGQLTTYKGTLEYAGAVASRTAQARSLASRSYAKCGS